MAEAMGPVFAAGFEFVSKSGYMLAFLPDLRNDELQREGKAPVYHWLPNAVRLARKNGDSGDYKFSFTHFAGVRNSNTHVGVEGKEEVSGGLLNFSTTSAPPASVLQEAQDELLNRFRDSDDKYWGWRTPVAPMFRPAPIVSNLMTITNLAPDTRGMVPAIDTTHQRAVGQPAVLRSAPSVRVAPSPRSFRQDLAATRSNLDGWYVNIGGQGSGSVSPFAENAFSGLVGSIPAALIWSSFHGGSGGISVWQNLQLKVWTPAIHLLIEGEWRKVQDHFSAAAKAGGVWWNAEVQAEFNNLRVSGDIKVTCRVDTTIPGADKLQAELDKRQDLVFNKFLEQAQKYIFDPAPFNEKPAETSGGFLGLGAGAAFKLRRDQTHVRLRYEETREIAYLQPYPISGQLEGLYDEIKADPTAEKKYFRTLDLGDWERKVSRVVKPVVNWPDPTRKWVGEPVAFLSAQIGYPNAEGVVQWDGHLFQSTDAADALWSTSTLMKAQADVANPPQGWSPDKTFVKRTIHFTEPPSEAENPFVRVFVEKNVVELDGEGGRLMNDINLEVRVDNVGVLSVGPAYLNVDLESPKQIVEVTFKASGQTADGHERQPTTFTWQQQDQTEPRHWMVFTGQPGFAPKYQYRVRVIVKGSIFTQGQEWIGPWQDVCANGPLMISVPTPEDEGVQKRSLPMDRFTGNGTVPGGQDHSGASQPQTTASGPPPSSSRAKAGTVRAGKVRGWSFDAEIDSQSHSDATEHARHAGNGVRSHESEDGIFMPLQLR